MGPRGREKERRRRSSRLHPASHGQSHPDMWESPVTTTSGRASRGRRRPSSFQAQFFVLYTSFLAKAPGQPLPGPTPSRWASFSNGAARSMHRRGRSSTLDLRSCVKKSPLNCATVGVGVYFFPHILARREWHTCHKILHRLSRPHVCAYVSCVCVRR